MSERMFLELKAQDREIESLREQLERERESHRQKIDLMCERAANERVKHERNEAVARAKAAEKERDRLREYLCAEHGYAACPTCVDDLRKAEKKLRNWELDARDSLCKELRDGLRLRGHWAPDDSGGDMIVAVFRAINNVEKSLAAWRAWGEKARVELVAANQFEECPTCLALKSEPHLDYCDIGRVLSEWPGEEG